jgi:hypothetical protein
MTANAPPPLASQLTEIYSGFALCPCELAVESRHVITIGTDLDQIGIPRISGDAQIVVTLFLDDRAQLCVGRTNIYISGHTFLVDCPYTCPVEKGSAFVHSFVRIWAEAYDTLRRAQIGLPC